MADDLQHDILIVGGGGAGLRAVIAAAEAHPDLDIAMVSKVYPMRSHTVSAEGGAAAVIKEDDSIEEHIHDTISGADWLADQDAVEIFVNEAPREMIQLEHWGCPWSREEDGSVAVRPFGGMRIPPHVVRRRQDRLPHAPHAVPDLAQAHRRQALPTSGSRRACSSRNGRCQGVIAIEMRTGEIHAIRARSVIMCTGGGGRVFPFTTNAAIKTGDGMAMAYRAGVALKDMEFVQYHPTGLPGTGILITEAARGEGGILVNNEGRRYLEDYNLGEPVPITDPRHPQLRTMELGPRDKLSQAFMKEQDAGRVFEGEYGTYTHLDVRHLGEKLIEERIPFVRELAKNYAGIDPVHEPIPVRPVVHYMMGGIHTDTNGETSLPGLFAAGECACVSINGANRLGSNSLTELLVFGRRAGLSAAEFAREHPDLDSDALEAQRADEEASIAARFRTPRDGGERLVAIRRDLNATMEEGVGVYRDESRLQATTDTLGELKERYQNVAIDDHSKSFNTELTTALELGFLLEVGEAVAHSALQRTESRGSHQRTDHPDRDDDQFLKHSLAFRTDGAPRIDYSDVTITNWPPAERTYGN